LVFKTSGIWEGLPKRLSKKKRLSHQTRKGGQFERNNNNRGREGKKIIFKERVLLQPPYSLWEREAKLVEDLGSP